MFHEFSVSIQIQSPCFCCGSTSEQTKCVDYKYQNVIVAYVFCTTHCTEIMKLYIPINIFPCNYISLQNVEDLTKQGEIILTCKRFSVRVFKMKLLLIWVLQDILENVEILMKVAEEMLISSSVAKAKKVITIY